MSYLGQGLGLGREERFTATATAGQTTVSVGDDGRSISYTPNYVDVYLNGSKQVNGSDITVTSGTSIVFASALTAGDVVDVVAPGYFQPADTVSRSLGGTFLGAVNLPSGGLNVGSGQLKVDASGRVLMSNQPCFHVKRAATTNFGAGGVIVWDTVVTNIGGAYSTSTGRFTAPVAGTYLFCATNNTISNSGDLLIRRNGVNIIGVEFDPSGSGGWLGSSTQAVLTLGVGDYIDCIYSASATQQVEGAPWNGFCGHLIG